MPATLYLCRHGDTPWSTERRFAGKTDLPLTADGEEAARLLGKRLRSFQFDVVLTSPLLRARQTAELAGFSAKVDERLMELAFGRLRRPHTRRDRPRAPRLD
ncbi:MAG TPA: histidine phosphatase family protein, partial [Myxococcales bacterium]